MVRLKRPDVDRWIGDAATSLMASFAAGLAKDKPAVKAAMTSPWSNGQTEGQITKLKLVKRQMYGRPKSTCWKLGFSAQPDYHRDCVRPVVGRDLTSCLAQPQRA